MSPLVSELCLAFGVLWRLGPHGQCSCTSCGLSGTARQLPMAAPSKQQTTKVSGCADQGAGHVG